MKNFDFRFERALRWRNTQLELQRGRVRAATARVQSATASIAELENAGEQAATQVAAATSGLQGLSYDGYAARLRREKTALNERLCQHQAALDQELRRAMQADTAVRLLDRLKTVELQRWTSEFDRELETFAGEAFLGRVQSERKRARSSSG